MISVLIKIMTVVFVLISIGTIENKKSIVTRIFKSINKSYLELVNQQGPIMGFLLKLFGIMLLGSFYLISFEKYCLLDSKDISFRNIVISVVIWIIASLIMYLGFGSLLAIFSKTVTLIGNMKNSKMGIKMMSSFLLLILLSYFSFMSESEMRDNLFFLFIGSVTCYVLNMQIMLKIVRNPFCVVGDKNEQTSENRMLIIFSSILIILMIIINMYLLVLWTYFSFDNAYTCSCTRAITKWDLLYYTIISFTTVGYGDIYPAIYGSQVVAILISITSVMCLIIFVSSILSEKDSIFGDNVETKSKQKIKSKTNY